MNQSPLRILLQQHSRSDKGKHDHDCKIPNQSEVGTTLVQIEQESESSSPFIGNEKNKKRAFHFHVQSCCYIEAHLT